MIQKIVKITDVSAISISSNESLKIDASQYPAITILRLPKIEKIEVISISKKVMNPVDRRQEIILERIIDFYYNTVFIKL